MANFQKLVWNPFLTAWAVFADQYELMPLDQAALSRFWFRDLNKFLGGDCPGSRFDVFSSAMDAGFVTVPAAKLKLARSLVTKSRAKAEGRFLCSSQRREVSKVDLWTGTVSESTLNDHFHRTRDDDRNHGTGLLWLRIGELRMHDNPALLAAATNDGCVLPLLTLVHPTKQCLEAAKDLRRLLQIRGSTLVVRLVNCHEEEIDVVRAVATAIGARRIYLNQNPRCRDVHCYRIWGSAVRIISCPGLEHVLNSPPKTFPALPGLVSMQVSSVTGTGFGGETNATKKAKDFLSANAWVLFSVACFVLREEIWLGCISRQRIRHMMRESNANRAIRSIRGDNAVRFNSDGVLALSMAAYDVNGGDRRGIWWDEKARKFRLREWEHAETERRMNAKQRGSEFVRRKKMFLTRAFFPDDVTPDYYSFTAWRFAQRCVSATVGVFGTQALLLALGVKAGRIGQAAAISWVLKDGLGRVGKMLWASGMGKDFDVDPKRWRFRSALLYAFGNGMEIVTQIFPASFLVVATLANSMKQVSMLTASATRNAMYRSFGDGAQNIANITAKGEAQIVVADLIGMSCGIQLSKAIGTSRTNVLLAYSILTVADIIGIYMELRQVVFRTLNAERSSLVIERYLRSGEILTPNEVSRMERIFLKPRYRSRTRFSSIVKAATSPTELDMLLHVFRKERFLVALPRKLRAGPCRVVLRKDADNEDVLRALLTVGYVLSKVRRKKKNGWRNGGNGGPETILRGARRAANKTAPVLIRELQRAGWNTENLLFGTVKRGASWGSSQ